MIVHDISWDNKNGISRPMDTIWYNDISYIRIIYFYGIPYGIFDEQFGEIVVKSTRLPGDNEVAVEPRACAAALAAAMETPRMALAPNLPKDETKTKSLKGTLIYVY